MAIKDPTLRTILVPDANAMNLRALELRRDGYKFNHICMVSIEMTKGNEIIVIRIEQKN